MPSRSDGSKPPDWTGWPPANLDIPEVDSSSDDELIWEMGIRLENMRRHEENVREADMSARRRFNPTYRNSRRRGPRMPRNQREVFYRGSRGIDWLERNQARQNRRRARPLRQRLNAINENIQQIVNTPWDTEISAWDRQRAELTALERSRNRIIERINNITGEVYDPDELFNS